MAELPGTTVVQDPDFSAVLDQFKALLMQGREEPEPEMVSPPVGERAPVQTLGGERPQPALPPGIVLDESIMNRLAQPSRQRAPVRNALQPQSPEEEAELSIDARSMGILLNATGAAPAYRATVAAREGRPIDAAGHAALAMMPFRPAMGLATLGGAYGGALATDLGAFEPSTAQAQSDPMGADRNMLQSLVTQQATLRAQAEAARQRMETERASGQGPRFTAAKQEYEASNARATAMDRQVDALNTRTSPAAVQQHEEYSRTVAGAERRLGEARGRVPRPFKDTNVGRLYEATGGWTPAVVGAGTAGIARAAGRGRLESMAEGTLAGALTPNAPMVWDLFSQPIYNPERAMYSDYARDLPPTHPRRQEWSDYARSLPEENPTRRLASETFYDPVNFAERTGIGALEGVVGSAVGANLLDVAKRIPGSIRNGLGNRLGRQPDTPPPPPSSSPLPSSPVPSAPPAGLLPPPGGSTNRLDPSSLMSSPANSNAQNASLPPVSPYTFSERSGRWHGPNGRFVPGSRKPPKDE